MINKTCFVQFEGKMSATITNYPTWYISNLPAPKYGYVYVTYVYSNGYRNDDIELEYLRTKHAGNLEFNKEYSFNFFYFIR